MNRLSLLMRYAIDTPQLRFVSIRSRSFSRLIAFGAARILTCEPVRRNPNPGSVACAACRIEDFSRFTVSFSRRSITPQTLPGHPLSSPFAAHEDPEVIGVTDEPVTAFPQLPVQVIQHDVRQDWRQRRTLRGPLRRRLPDPVDHHPGLQVAPDQPQDLAVI